MLNVGRPAILRQSLDLAQVLIQPGDHLPHKIGSLLRDIVRGVQHDSLFFRCRGAEQVSNASFPRKIQSNLPAMKSAGALTWGAKSAWSVPGSALSPKNPPSVKITALKRSSTPAKITPNAAPMLSPM